MKVDCKRVHDDNLKGLCACRNELQEERLPSVDSKGGGKDSSTNELGGLVLDGIFNGDPGPVVLMIKMSIDSPGKKKEMISSCSQRKSTIIAEEEKGRRANLCDQTSSSSRSSLLVSFGCSPREFPQKYFTSSSSRPSAPPQPLPHTTINQMFCLSKMKTDTRLTGRIREHASESWDIELTSKCFQLIIGVHERCKGRILQFKFGFRGCGLQGGEGREG